MASGPFVPLLTPPSPSAPPRSASFNMRHVHFDTAGDPQVLGEGCDDDPPITPEPPEMAYQISQTP